MPRLRCRLLALLCTLVPVLAQAAVTLEVKGLDENLEAVARQSVELSQYTGGDASDAQVRRLYARAPQQITTALRPYGYYDAKVDGTIQHVGKDWQVTLTVHPGQPVKVTSLVIELDRQAANLPEVRRAIRQFQPAKGQRMNDGLYDASRDAISAALTATGFLDARLTTHRVEVTRAAHSAVVKLRWEVGRRYRFGEVHFKGSPFRPGFLARYVPWKSGDYFAQNQLLQLQRALNGADYFSVVNVLPNVEGAKDGVLDVNVELVPAKRSIYTGGPFIGTDTGFGLRAGLERRWVNDRGHKWKNEIVLAQRLKTLTTLYTVPLPGRNQRARNYGATFRDADTTTSHSRTLELVANETQLWHGWLRTLGVHALSGTFTVGQRGNEPDNTPGIERGTSTLVYPEISLVKKHGNNPTFVRHGWSLTLAARSTVGALLSDTRFTQLYADGKWIDAFKGHNRLILRGTLGITSTGDFSQLPPQLRYFAGGDRSVRGYGYQSLGPRNSHDRVIGGRNLLVASAEVEHYFNKQWGIAAFVDAGNAFSGTDFRAQIGAGLGLRWLSPVGMIRVDVGTPVHSARHHGVQLHLVIGPDL